MNPPYGYWTFDGRNGLSGLSGTIEQLPDGREVIVPNPENPAVLDDGFILNALKVSPKARNDFNILFPNLLPEEQARLTELLEATPFVSLLNTDTQTYYDNIQQYNVSAGVRVRMPRPIARLPGRPPGWIPYS